MSDILLVEDDAQLARNLIRFLRAEGFSVTHRISQTAALEAFAAQKFDCALVDISLAEGNGFSVCAAIKRESATPVIFLTASADEDCTVAGFEIGADDYISKPFRPRELIARMKNVMRRSKPADTMISCGDVVVDTSRGTVTKDGSEVLRNAEKTFFGAPPAAPRPSDSPAFFLRIDAYIPACPRGARFTTCPVTACRSGRSSAAWRPLPACSAYTEPRPLRGSRC